MEEYISEKLNLIVKDKKGITGNLIKQIKIKLKGNYRKELIKVEVIHEFIFTPDSKFFEINQEDGEFNSYQITKCFDKKEELEMYIKNNFEII